MTDQELDQEIERARDSEEDKKREWLCASNALAKLIAEKQRRWVDTLSPEDISNL